MADSRRQSERYARIARELIESEPSLARIRDGHATICYLESPAAKRSGGRPRLGECERVPDRWRWAVPADFCVTVFEPNVEGLSDDQLRVLLHHELLHVGIEGDGEGGERYSIVPHDLEDFREIVDAHGADWAQPA